MITKEQFEAIQSRYGCGYWHVCDDNACPCGPTAAVSKGFNEEVYARMERQNEKLRRELEKEFDLGGVRP